MSDEERTKAFKQLLEPFGPQDINHLPKGGTTLDYVGHAAVTRRLLDVDPEWNWEPLAYTETGLPAITAGPGGEPTGLWIKLTVLGVTRLGYGSVESRKAEPVKELIGDAIRNAAMRFGVALDLWKKHDAHDASSSQRSQQRRQGTRQAPSVAPGPSEGPQEPSPATSEKPSLPGHVKRLWALSNALGLSEEEVHKRCGVSSLRDLLPEDARKIADLWKDELDAKAKENVESRASA